MDDVPAPRVTGEGPPAGGGRRRLGRHLWSNLALLGLLVLQVVTGVAGLLGVGDGFRVLLWLHAAGAYALVVVLLAKGALVLGVLRRRPGWTSGRVQLAVAVVLLAAVLLSGLVWITAGRRSVAGVSLINWHAYLAILLVAVIVSHVVDRRWVARAPAARDRRAALRVIGAAAVGVAVAAVERPVQRLAGTPGARRRWTGSYPVAASGPFPVVSWWNDDPERIDRSRWALRVEGRVARPLRLTEADLREMPARTARVTLDCTGGWYAERTWSGVTLGAVLDAAGVMDDGGGVLVESVTGYGRRFAVADARRLILALDVEGRPLTHGHGAPLRLVVPDGRGFEWVKWITRIEVGGRPSWLESPLPLA